MALLSNFSILLYRCSKTMVFIFVFPTLYLCVCVCVCVRTRIRALSSIQLFVAPWTVVHKVPLPIEFSRQECWSGIPFLPPGDLPHPQIKPSYISCIGRRILYHQHHLGSPHFTSIFFMKSA